MSLICLDCGADLVADMCITCEPDEGLRLADWFDARVAAAPMVLEAPSVETIMAFSWVFGYRDPEPLTPAQANRNDADRDSDDGPEFDLPDGAVVE